jgi:Rrf2 family protein
MLRVSKKAEYALLAMAHLARKGGSASAREIAEQHDIPVELLAKVLQQLTRRGLLVSQQGTRGGYQLSQDAAGISVADVIHAIDGPVVMTACHSRATPCGRFETCMVRDPLSRIAEVISSALSKTSVSELAVEPPAPDELVLSLKGRL